MLTAHLSYTHFKHSDWLKILSGQPECMNNGVAKIYAKFLYRIGYSFWCTQSGPSNGYIIR